MPVEIVLADRAGAPPGPSLATSAARPRPQSVPRPEGTRPNGKAQPEDELSAKLRALAQLRQPNSALPVAEGGGGAGGSATGQGGYALKDFVRAQILRRWLPNLQSAHIVTENGTRKRVRVCTSCLSAGKVTKAG